MKHLEVLLKSNRMTTAADSLRLVTSCVLFISRFSPIACNFMFAVLVWLHVAIYLKLPNEVESTNEFTSPRLNCDDHE